MLTTLQKGDLEVRSLQDLDECRFQTRYFEPITNSRNQPDGIDLGADVFQQCSDEVRARLGVLQQILPQILVRLLFGKVDGLTSGSRNVMSVTDPLNIAQPLDDEHQSLLVVAHPS